MTLVIDSVAPNGAFAQNGPIIPFTTDDGQVEDTTQMIGSEIILIRRIAASTTTVVIASAPLNTQQTSQGPLLFTMQTGDEFSLMGPFSREGWLRNEGLGKARSLLYGSTDTDVEIAAIRIPGLYLEPDQSRVRGNG